MAAHLSEEISNKIRAARKKLGWSQTVLGERAGLSRPTIARVEAGRDVSTATLSKVAEVLGLKLDLLDRRR